MFTVQMVLCINEYSYFPPCGNIYENFFSHLSLPNCYSAFARSNNLAVKQSSLEIRYHVFLSISRIT